MRPRVLKLKKQSILASVFLLVVVCSYEACSPMKSTYETQDMAANICSAIYDPPASLISKATAHPEKIKTLFEEKKVHLDSTVSGKAKTLQNTKIALEINLKCDSMTDSLSAKVLKQNEAQPLLDLSIQNFDYLVEENLTVNDITALAESDPCVIGVTYGGTLKATALMLPSSTDLNISYQNHLASTNYLHAYENMVKKANTSTKTKIAFVDTGVQCAHPDLQSNMVSGCGTDMTSSGNVNDNDGHGTHTLGIVGAVTDNKKGVLGIAGNTATMTAIKVINLGTGSAVAAANGIQYAIDNNMDVINISLEADSTITEVESKIQSAVSAGIVVVIAAGNSGALIGTSSPGITVSPAQIGKGLNGAITVASVNADSMLMSYFSNYGSFAEIAAPGSLIDAQDSAKAGLYSTTPGGTYKRMMGTSQAAPIVTGAAGLLIQFFKQRGVSYTPAKIEEIIKASADTNTKVNVQGNRVLNFSKLTRNAYAVAGIDLCAKATTDK